MTSPSGNTVSPIGRASLPITLVPGSSAGLFCLSTSLYATLRLLAANHHHYKVAYSQTHLLQTPIVVSVPGLFTRLTFDPCWHRCVLIEVVLHNSPTPPTVAYNLHHITPNPSFPKIYNHVFGPTFPGYFSASDTYVLSYPGIVFQFDTGGVMEGTVGEPCDLLLEPVDHSKVRCSTIGIHRGENWKEWVGCWKELLLGEPPLVANAFGAVLDLPQSVKINPRDGKVSLEGVDGSVTLHLNSTTQQEALRVLGPPDEVFRKPKDSRILIQQTNVPGVCHNYFLKGVDLVYDTAQSPAVLVKAVFHLDAVEAVDFGRWSKCRWEMVNIGNAPATLEMYFDQLPELVVGKRENPVFLDRNALEFVNTMEMVDGMDGEEVAWGQTRLYGHGRCVWEVLGSGVVTGVTVF